MSATSGIGRSRAPSMGMICFDYEDDGDTDIFVATMPWQTFLFQNDGTGQLRRSRAPGGWPLIYQGVINGSMGVDCGDYDNDGLLDLFMTDYPANSPCSTAIWGGLFEDVTRATGAGDGSLPTKWGTGLVDFDNDGDRDIFIACGHFLENIREIDDRLLSSRQRPADEHR